jgi:NADH-quinone oxidoreductase subunit L
MTAVAWLGLATLLLAAFAALVQRDIKRILAYSTISQIGYMFLALGVGAFGFGIFHLMTHAFFKALLFLGAGAVIHCLHHEHDIFRMGGLRTRLPVVFASFLIGSAALAALPLTSGFYSKDGILLAAWTLPEIGPWLWAGGLLGALLTGIYSFRLLFVAFFGEASTEPDRRPGPRMAIPLAILCVLALLGGAIGQPLDGVLPAMEHPHVPGLVAAISIAVPLAGLGIAWLFYLDGRFSAQSLLARPALGAIQRFLFSGWQVDRLYDFLVVRPYRGLARACRAEPVDLLYSAVVGLNRMGHRALSALQTGELRWYATTLALGLILVIALALRAPA